MPPDTTGDALPEVAGPASVGDDCLVKRRARPGANNVSYRVSRSQGVNIAHESPGADQTVVTSVSRELQAALTELAERIDELTGVAGSVPLPARFVMQAPAVADELRAAALAPAADRNRLWQLVDNARELALLTAAVPLGEGLLLAVEQLAHVLGIG